MGDCHYLYGSGHPLRYMRNLIARITRKQLPDVMLVETGETILVLDSNGSVIFEQKFYCLLLTKHKGVPVVWVANDG